MGGDSFDSLEQAEETIQLLFQLYHQTDVSLKQQASFEPLILRDDTVIPYKDATFEEVGHWCRGYLAGAFLDPLWRKEEVGPLLFPFAVLAGIASLEGEEDGKGVLITDDHPYEEMYRDNLMFLVHTFHEKWAETRLSLPPISAQSDVFSEAIVKTGRNDPCPCGSGKKYKKCCLH